MNQPSSIRRQRLSFGNHSVTKAAWFLQHCLSSQHRNSTDLKTTLILFPRIFSPSPPAQNDNPREVHSTRRTSRFDEPCIHLHEGLNC